MNVLLYTSAASVQINVFSSFASGQNGIGRLGMLRDAVLKKKG